MRNEMKKLLKGRNIHKIALAIALVFVVNIGVSGTAAYLFAKTNTIINTFVSGIAPYGAVKITKNVEHKYGDDYIIPDNISFSFDVDMGEDCAGMKFCDDRYTADETGIVSLTLKDKNEVVLNKIPVGTKVKVTEKNLKKGFTVKGEATRTKEVEMAETSEFDYVNEYEAEAPDFSKVKVFGAKEISGRAWIDTDSYKIVLEQYKNNAWQKITDKEVKKGSNTFDFSEAVAGIDVNNIGTYSFKISEEAGEAGGITYDTNISCFNIVVTDSDMDGKMEIADVISSSSNTNVTKNEETGKFDVKVTFTNKYAPAGSAETFVNITKKLDVVSGGERTLAGYKFELYDKAGNKAGEAFSNAAGEAVIKMVFEPEDAGMPEDGGKEFTYKLKEINLKEPGVIYDSKEYSIKVSVVDNLDGTISAYIYDAKHKEIPEDADNEYSAAFTNRYAPKPASVEMTGKKILEGRKLKSDEFTFVLSEADKNFSPVKVLSETKNTASGSFKLNTLSFKSEGEYYYLVTEKTDKKAKGITFDTSTYRVAVKVTDDNNGSLHADASISKEKSDSVWPVDNVTFTNTYKKPASPGTPERGKSNNPKTGDPTDLALWLLVMLTSLEAIVILIVISLMSRTKDH